MGRVTFQDPQVIEAVNRDFVPTWVNTLPSFIGTELKVQGEDVAPAFAKYWPSGHATTNVKCVVSTAQGEVIHVIPGFVRGPELLRELRFAADLGKALDRAGQDPAARRKVFLAAQKGRLADLEKAYGKLDPKADLDTDSLKPDEVKADHFAHLMMAVTQILVDEPTQNRSDECTECTSWSDLGAKLAPMISTVTPGNANPPPQQTSAQLSETAASLRATAAELQKAAIGPAPPANALVLGGQGSPRISLEQWRAMKAQEAAQLNQAANEIQREADAKGRTEARASRSETTTSQTSQSAKRSGAGQFRSNMNSTMASNPSLSRGPRGLGGPVTNASAPTSPGVGGKRASGGGGGNGGAGSGSNNGCGNLSAADIEAARQCFVYDSVVSYAIAAHGSREQNPEAWKVACTAVKHVGAPAYGLLLDRLALSDQAGAAYDVLRHVTGQVIPDDEGAWTIFVAAQ